MKLKIIDEPWDIFIFVVIAEENPCIEFPLHMQKLSCSDLDAFFNVRGMLRLDERQAVCCDPESACAVYNYFK